MRKDVSIDFKKTRKSHIRKIHNTYYLLLRFLFGKGVLSTASSQPNNLLLPEQLPLMGSKAWNF